MKKHLVLICFAVAGSSNTVFSQDIPVVTQQQLENLAMTEQGETEDDTYIQELEQFRKNPVNLNTADANELRQLRILNDLQVASLITYRSQLGKFINLYELQAVPGWNIETIKKLLPYITINEIGLDKSTITRRFTKGEHSLLLRASQVLERSAGYDNRTSPSGYLGSPVHLFFRYRYQYRNLLQYGLTGDKDAGEQFFRGAQRAGFDFYSFHFFVRKAGLIQSLAIGDFTVNMGQGLVQWQSLAFKKSADVMGIKRQSATLRPYSSSGEFYFNRGAGVTLQKGKIESTVFISRRKLSANLVPDQQGGNYIISSFLTSGYHRSASENADRNTLVQTAAGGNIIYRNKRWHAALNTVYYLFSVPVQKRNEPYNLFAISGSDWYNLGADYSWTYKNIHFFGEVAMDKHFSKAFVNGLLISLDPRVDLALLHRHISKSYQAVNGNAFTENTYPSNESGLYAGVCIRPAAGWRLDCYADIYHFPWLKYLVDAPSYGSDYLLQLTYSPGKNAEVIVRYKTENKQGNQPGNITAEDMLISIPRQNWRVQVNQKINSSFIIRSRAEMQRYDRKRSTGEHGFLTFTDIIYKPMLKHLSGGVRLQYFETDGYNSRIYAYENDVPYSFSIPSFYDKGFRYYLNLNLDIGKKLGCWLRLAQTIYPDKLQTGSDAGEIKGNKKTELRFQARYIF